MSEVFLPFKPRRDDEFGHMVVQQNVDALLKEVNGLTTGGGALDIITNPAANGASEGDVLTWQSGQIMWRSPAIRMIERQQKFSDASPTFDFQTMPSSDYKHLLLVGHVKGTDAAAQVAWLRFNSDSAGNYDYQHTVGQGATAGAGAGAAQSGGYGAFVPGTGYDGPSSVFIFIPDFNETVLRKCAKSIGGVADQTGADTNISQASSRRNTAAITSVQLTVNAGNFKTGSSMSLYGVALSN